MLGVDGLNAAALTANGVILARSLYRIRRVSLVDVLAAERRAVLRNFCLAWQPFDESVYGVQLQADGALLFAWDRRVLTKTEAPLNVVPETCCRPKPTADGLRVMRTSDGVEAEIWRQAELRVSRWWPQTPSLEESAQWLASQGELANGLGWPEPVEMSRASRQVWPILSLDELTRSGSRMERLMALATAFVLSGFAGVVGMQTWHSHQQFEVARQVAATQQLTQAPTKRARDEALRLVSDVRNAELALAEASPLQVLEHLGQVLKPGVELRELELKGRVLRLVVNWPSGVPRSSLLQDLQAGGWMRGAKELRDGLNLSPGQMAVELELSALGPNFPTQPAPSASAAPTAPSGLPRPGVSP